MKKTNADKVQKEKKEAENQELDLEKIAERKRLQNKVFEKIIENLKNQETNTKNN